MKLNVLSTLALALTKCLGVVATRPNFVFILTDDQDYHMGSVAHMPEVQEYLVQKGVEFKQHYCTIAICCPSRVDLWTGQMSHNTNVTNVGPPWGGYPKFIQNGYNDHHLALWMQESGYNTYYAGKLFNAHSISNYDSPHMSGYTHSDFFLEPYTYQYFNVGITHDGEPPYYPLGDYSTDIVAESAQRYINDALSDEDGNPFFITLAPVAPHVWLYDHGEDSVSGPPPSAPRHEGLFPDYKIPRTDNFNPDEPSGVNWISTLAKLNDTVIEYNDEFQRHRMRALMAVDEMVGDVVRRLDEEGVLNNTYVIFSSDNGFHISQHRMHPGKMCGLDTDIRVPLIVRGPGIEEGSIRADVSTHTDLAPTIMKLAGNEISDKQFDGAPITIGPLDPASPGRLEHVAVEFWGIGLMESKYAEFTGQEKYLNNTYKGLRIVSDDYGFYYSVWCNNEKELYDMKSDPGQLRNLLSDRFKDQADAFRLADRSLPAIENRLDALMMVLKSCKEVTCVDPWGALHPNGDVSRLTDALSTDYDDFYEGQTKVEFERCMGGYLIDAEGPMEYNVYMEEELRRAIDHTWSWRI